LAIDEVAFTMLPCREQKLLEQLVGGADGYVQPILKMVCLIMPAGHIAIVN